MEIGSAGLHHSAELGCAGMPHSTLFGSAKMPYYAGFRFRVILHFVDLGSTTLLLTCHFSVVDLISKDLFARLYGIFDLEESN